MPYPHPLVTLLAAQRIKLGWTQEAVARRINVAQNCLSQWETGNNSPPLPRLEAYATAVGLRLELVPAADESGGGGAVKRNPLQRDHLLTLSPNP